MSVCEEGGDPGAGWGGRHFSGGGWLSLDASSLSERNSPGAPLPAPLPARISPRPPPLQERRPAPICHPLCEGGSPGLGSGGSGEGCPEQAGPSVHIWGPDGGGPSPSLRVGSPAPPSAPAYCLCCCLSGAQVLAQSLVLSSLPLGTTLQPSLHPPAEPWVEGFYKNRKTKYCGLFTWIPEKSL